MMKQYLILAGLITLVISIKAQNADCRDIYPDTWVATDALGRAMPDMDETGRVKTDHERVVGIFYITWHSDYFHKDSLAKIKAPYMDDVSKVLDHDPSARFDYKHPLWKKKGIMYHWGEPEMGYFLSQDEWVIRKDMSMLADAGVDVLVMDVTNAVRYWDEWEVTFKTMQKMKAEGNRVPQFCFWAFNGPVITVVQDLYERIYKEKKYRNLWFYWDGKPLLLYNSRPFISAARTDKHPNLHYEPEAKTNPDHPHYLDPDFTEEFYSDYSEEVKSFFTLRTMWWGYYNWGGKRFIGTEDNWSFGYSMADPEVKALKPEQLLSLHNGKREQAAVTPAQHPVTMTKENMGVGKSWSREYGEPPLNDYDMPTKAYVPYLGKTVEHPENYGIYFQERWDDAIAADPEFLYINDWNEWTAGKYNDTVNWLGRRNSFRFIDQYNAEFNRTVQPMKGGYTDNYYMQMAQNIRRYKGVRPIPQHKGFNQIGIDGSFDDWKTVADEFRDTKGDVAHRNYNGYGGLHYSNTSGRNDILTAKVAVDSKNILFYAETAAPLTSHTDNNWMLLLIDADNNSATGWHGYDFIINKKINGNKTAVMRYNPKNKQNPWKEIATADYRYAENKIEIAIPRNLLGLTSEKFVFDFKWSDNPADLNTIISLCINGDTAPNRRFNYRFIWEQ